MSESNNDEVICPNCCHQFRAIPVNVQAELEKSSRREASMEESFRRENAAKEELLAVNRHLRIELAKKTKTLEAAKRLRDWYYHRHGPCVRTDDFDTAMLGCQQSSSDGEQTQSTTCAVCGERKHTPLRNDAMGGYVCLTCIDRELMRLQRQSRPVMEVEK